MTIKIDFDELFEILRSYQYEQECIMDACDDATSYKYITASSKWLAASNLTDILSEKEIEIFKKECEYYD